MKNTKPTVYSILAVLVISLLGCGIIRPSTEEGTPQINPPTDEELTQSVYLEFCNNNVPNAQSAIKLLGELTPSNKSELSLSDNEIVRIHCTNTSINSFENLKFRFNGYTAPESDSNAYNINGWKRNNTHKDTGTEFHPETNLTQNGNEYDSNGYNINGWKRNNTHKDTGTEFHPETDLTRNGNEFDSDGYNYLGYNSDGWNRQNIHRDTGTRYNSQGWDRQGNHESTGTNRDSNGFDINGYNERGFNPETKLHKNGTLYDSNGLDIEGYNSEGYIIIPSTDDVLIHRSIHENNVRFQDPEIDIYDHLFHFHSRSRFHTLNYSRPYYYYSGNAAPNLVRYGEHPDAIFYNIDKIEEIKHQIHSMTGTYFLSFYLKIINRNDNSDQLYVVISYRGNDGHRSYDVRDSIEPFNEFHKFIEE